MSEVNCGVHVGFGRMRSALATMSLVLFCLTALTQPGCSQLTVKQVLPIPFLCGNEGQACCPDLGPGGLPAGPPNCSVGHGCDISVNRCVAACGGAGQPCCDGPDTLSPRGGASPTGFSAKSLKPMCATGSCSSANHRCLTCGQLSFQACCPPGRQTAVSTCPVSGLYCKTTSPDGDFGKGVCEECGQGGLVPCPVDRCDIGYVASDDICVLCGEDGQPPCVDGCKDGFLAKLEVKKKVCRPCGHIGENACAKRVCFEGLPVAFQGQTMCVSRNECVSFILEALTNRSMYYRYVATCPATTTTNRHWISTFAEGATLCASRSDADLASILQTQRNFIADCKNPPTQNGSGGGGGSSSRCCYTCSGGGGGVPSGGSASFPPSPSGSGCTYQYGCGAQCN